MADEATTAAAGSTSWCAASAAGSGDDQSTMHGIAAAEHLNAPAEGRAVPVSSAAQLEKNLYAPLFDVLSGAGVACKKGYITDTERHLLFDIVAQSVSQLMPVARACVAERLRREAAV